MDIPTDFTFAVFWDGEDEPEQLSLEAARALATDEFHENADWQSHAVQKLQRVGGCRTLWVRSAS